MKEFICYVRISGNTKKFLVRHYSHDDAREMVAMEIKGKPHGGIFAREVK